MSGHLRICNDHLPPSLPLSVQRRRVIVIDVIVTMDFMEYEQTMVYSLDVFKKVIVTPSHYDYCP